jgi:glyoxylase-like metal-dependent hydrolase (beta-lactamase superfamily II)
VATGSQDAGFPRTGSATVDVLQPGYAREELACTHAWWGADGPARDPFAPDPAVLAASRARILAIASVIIPGHGPAFVPDDGTPR